MGKLNMAAMPQMARNLQGQTLCGSRHFFSVILNGEVVRLEIPVEIYGDYKAEAQKWVEAHPVELSVKDYTLADIKASYNEASEYRAGNLLRFLAEPYFAAKDRPSFFEMKELMAYAYGICCHTKGMRPLRKWFNAYNNHMVKQWLKVLPTIEW